MKNTIDLTEEGDNNRRRSKRLINVEPLNYFPKKLKTSDANSKDTKLCVKCGMGIEEDDGIDDKCAECASDGTFNPEDNKGDQEEEVEDSDIEENSDDEGSNYTDKNKKIRNLDKTTPESTPVKRTRSLRTRLQESDDEETNKKSEMDDDEEFRIDSEEEEEIKIKSKRKKAKTANGEEEIIYQCEFCKKTKTSADNKMVSCMTCSKCLHVGCMLPQDVPDNLVFDDTAPVKFVAKKLGCVRCQSKKLPYKVHDILWWRWRDDIKDHTDILCKYNTRQFFIHYKPQSYWKSTWVSEVQLDICEANLFRYYKKKQGLLKEPPVYTDDDEEENNESSTSNDPEMKNKMNIMSPKKQKKQQTEQEENKSEKNKVHELSDMLIRHGVEPEWLQPERVIDVTDKQCFVKWRNREYELATYELLEDAAEVPGLNELIKKWKVFKKELTDSNWKPKPKSKIKKLLVSPPYLGPQNLKDSENIPKLHDYQMEGLNWLRSCYAKSINTILADEMGLGKTVQAISLVYTLYKEGISRGPFLIVVPLSTMINWEREISFWAPDFNVLFYYGLKDSRKILKEQDFYYSWKNKKHFKFHAIITTYELTMVDESFLNKINWEMLVIDEAHRLKNNASKLFKVLTKYQLKYRMLMTGTPLQNNLEELFHLLNFMEPNKFMDMSNFLSRFEDISKAEQVQNLQDMLKIHLLRRIKDDVFKEIPVKEEQIVRVEMTPEQKDMYRMLLTKSYTELTGKFNTVKLANLMMQLRKCCNHPYLCPLDQKHTDPTDQKNAEMVINASGKMILMRKMMEKLIERGHKILVFSTMKIALNMIEYLLEDMKLNYERIDGSVSALERQDAIDRFNIKASSKVFLLSTRAGGLGINLVSADTVFIYDSDWNPHNDIQALSRAHRIGQKKKVMIYRFVMRNSVEEKMIEVAKKKMMVTSLVVKDYDKSEFHKILSFGTKELFSEETEANKAITYDDNAIEQLLDRNREIQADKKDDILSSCFSGFQVANYEFAEDEENDEENKKKEETENAIVTEPQQNQDPNIKSYWAQLLDTSVMKLMQEEKEKQLKSLEDLGKGKRKRTAVSLFVANPRAQYVASNLLTEGLDDVVANDDASEYEAEDSEGSWSSSDSADYSDKETAAVLASASVNKPSLIDMVGLPNNGEPNKKTTVQEIAMMNARKNGDLTQWAHYGMDTNLIKSDTVNLQLYKNVIKRKEFSVVDGFYPRERMEVYKAMMNFGLPSKMPRKGDRWWPDGLMHKKPEHMWNYLCRLSANILTLSHTVNGNFKDNSPKDDVDYDLILTRIGIMSLINFKVNYYEDRNSKVFDLLLERTEDLSFQSDMKFYAKLLEEFKDFQIFDGGFTDLNDGWFMDPTTNQNGDPNGLADDTANSTSPVTNGNSDAAIHNASSATNGNTETATEATSDYRINWLNIHDYLLLVAVSLYGYDNFLDTIFKERFLSPVLLLPFRCLGLDIIKDNQKMRQLILNRLSILERALLIETQLVKICIAVDYCMTDSFPVVRLTQLDSFMRSQVACSQKFATTGVISNIAKAKAMCQLELLINDIGSNIGPKYQPFELKPSMR